MASLPRMRPVLAKRTNISTCRYQRRTFASTPYFQAAGHNRGETGNIATRLGKSVGQKSMASHMRKMRKQDVPNDLGILPETFIKPEFSDLPSIFTSPKQRIRIEYRAFIQKAKDFFTLIYYNKWAVKKHPITAKKLRLPIYLRDRYSIARDLQKQLYTAVATSDVSTLNKIACQGLLQQLNIRVQNRRASGATSSSETWRVSYRGLTPPAGAPWLIQVLCPFKSTRIIADRTAVLPFGNDAKIRQVIVKIRSRQTLDKGDGKGEITKDMDEYFVLQRMAMEGQEDDWMIWGTTKPATLQEVEKMLSEASTGSGAWDQYKQKVGEYMNTASKTV